MLRQSRRLPGTLAVRTALLISAVAATACSTEATAPARFGSAAGTLAALSSATGTGAKAPKLKPNKEKYRDKGHKPATGRAGSAVLTTRALLGKDGMTSLDVTTGELD